MQGWTHQRTWPCCSGSSFAVHSVWPQWHFPLYVVMIAKRWVFLFVDSSMIACEFQDSAEPNSFIHALQALHGDAG